MTSPIPKLLAGLIVLAGLCGCGKQDSDWGQLYAATRDSIMGGDPTSVSLKQAAAVPYASLGVRVGDRSQILIVLVIDSPHMRLWTAGKAIALETRDGRIVRSSGLPFNLASIADAPSPLNADAGTHETLAYDFPDLNLYSLRVVCTIVGRTPAHITVLGKNLPVTRIDEQCGADTIGWTFTNVYWAGESGLVWKSIQHIHPGLDAVETEILRPPSSAMAKSG